MISHGTVISFRDGCRCKPCNASITNMRRARTRFIVCVLPIEGEALFMEVTWPNAWPADQFIRYVVDLAVNNTKTSLVGATWQVVPEVLP